MRYESRWAVGVRDPVPHTGKREELRCNMLLASCVGSLLVHELADLALLPILTEERHPAIGRQPMCEQADAPSEERPERSVRRRGSHEIDHVQEEVDRHEDGDVKIECPSFSDTTAGAFVPIPIVGQRRRHEDAQRVRCSPEGVKRAKP